ncbi:putative Muramoyltetrapeptide carboxypeptidase [Xenorhabdus bovienii str. Jollieti]|nr:LD-carboxypeptidase [Xenorhabdus bovienii]CDH27082.1 putative Muramoyltetrapeptide carboxypeptidase [Xenorhabdus bovienii str. Jollieti]
MAKITIVAPANTMCNLDTKMIDVGLKNLSNLGYVVSINDESFFDTENIAGTTAQRASSINRAILSENTDIIMAVFGGYNCNDLLEHIDFIELHRTNKVLIGYSDITALLNAYYAVTGGVSFHGPGFGTFCNPSLPAETVNGFTKALRLTNIEERLIQPQMTASDLWFLKSGFGPREWKSHPEWRTINEGEIKGILIGGNIESLVNLIGTKYCPDFDNKILLLESGFNTDPSQFRMWVSHLKACGIFDKISGLLIGNFTECSRKRFSPSYLDNLISEFVPEIVPTLVNFSSSHTDPILTLPIGGFIHMKLSNKQNEICMSVPEIP